MTGVQTCALPISSFSASASRLRSPLHIPARTNSRPSPPRPPVSPAHPARTNSFAAADAGHDAAEFAPEFHPGELYEIAKKLYEKAK